MGLEEKPSHTLGRFSDMPRDAQELLAGQLQPALQSEVPINELRALINSALLATGHRAGDAAIITDTIMYAELRGNNQGVVKLVTGSLTPSKDQGEPAIVYESKLSATINGNNCPGIPLLQLCVDKAIAKCSEHGMSVVACSGYSSPSGALGHWARLVAQKGFIAIVMSQCPEYVAPYGSYEPLLGTNPIAFGIPVDAPSLAQPIVLDMATSAIAYCKPNPCPCRSQLTCDDVFYDRWCSDSLRER